MVASGMRVRMRVRQETEGPGNTWATEEVHRALISRLEGLSGGCTVKRDHILGLRLGETSLPA